MMGVSGQTPPGGGQQTIPPQPVVAAGGADLQIVYNVEYLFEEDGKEVRKVPIEMNGETIWVESVGGVESLGPGGLYKSQDSIIMDLNENDGRFFISKVCYGSRSILNICFFFGVQECVGHYICDVAYFVYF